MTHEDEQLERKIALAMQRYLYTGNREHWEEAKRLHGQRSPARVEEMERDRGLR